MSAIAVAERDKPVTGDIDSTGCGAVIRVGSTRAAWERDTRDSGNARIAIVADDRPSVHGVTTTVLALDAATPLVP